MNSSFLCVPYSAEHILLLSDAWALGGEDSSQKGKHPLKFRPLLWTAACTDSRDNLRRLIFAFCSPPTKPAFETKQYVHIPAYWQEKQNTGEY